MITGSIDQWLQAASILAFGAQVTPGGYCPIVRVWREPPKHPWPPGGNYRQGWLVTLANGKGLWAESSDTFRDPTTCQAWLLTLGRSNEIPPITKGETKQLLTLLHAIASDQTPTHVADYQPGVTNKPSD